MGERAVHFYFKLFKNVKSEHEAEILARLELESLFGDVKPIFNFIDYALEEPLSHVLNAKFVAKDLEGGEDVRIRLLDVLTHELPYGRVQGYYGVKDKIEDVSSLVRRLGYTREIIVVARTKSPEECVARFFPEYCLNFNTLFTRVGDYSVFRFVTHQYFLEKSEYISKLSRSEEEVDRNVVKLFNNLMGGFYRIPASATMRVGKRLEDYFAIREEPSLYLTHYMHPYKGKFHPKMIRAILNYIYPYGEGRVLDNFAGSGTLLVEGILMGLESYGVEINPLSVLMSNVKCQSLVKIRLEGLLEEFEKLLGEAEKRIDEYLNLRKGQSTLRVGINFEDIERRRKEVKLKLKNYFDNQNDFLLGVFIIVKDLIDKIENVYIKQFLQLTLSGTISDLLRRRKADFLEVFRGRFKDLYLRLYLFHSLNKYLKIDVEEGVAYEGDARDMRDLIPDNSIDAILNSPPYSTALDYIKNDMPQLVILHLYKDWNKLLVDMIGNPSLNYTKLTPVVKSLLNKNADYMELTETARNLVDRLISSRRKNEALRTYKFFIDMNKTLKEMFRVLKPGSKCAIIIGNNHYKIDSEYIEIQNDEVIRELGEKIGFRKDRVIRRELEKTSTGNIRYESIVILEKPA